MFELVEVSEMTPLKPDGDPFLLPTPADYRGRVKEDTGIEALEKRDDITMVTVPDLMCQLDKNRMSAANIMAMQNLLVAHCTRMQDRVAILDAPPDYKEPLEIEEYRRNIANFDSSYATLYYPWIKVQDPATNSIVEMPPSGFIAGIWARSDNTRGVHKAPANEVVRGAVGLTYNVSKGEQEVLNPAGINCMRAMPGMGIRVWGARTVSSNPAWRYLNVRRLFNFVEKSIERGTQWVVFEPNDHRLWAKVRRDVNAFLLTVWRDGALFGLTPDQAYYVKCDETNNPRESRDLGRLIIEIGLAPVKPAEFVIFRISQWAGPGAQV
jgi:phage tail sheath protein FI